ncbi:GNAT family N-acetyltransferase [Piscibacillus sp. B03]|uniref:GNAT family N-acetyltransferase n=1 Tax=Piscibacillus sp. B03 TaxID=3457430 RepID=UPI003FCD5CFB
MEIREYNSSNEVGWLRCRVLSFLNTAYFDNVLNQKEIYNNPSIELVAINNGEVVGLLDIEYEKKENDVCTGVGGIGGMIWHIATHPDHQRKGIATKLLEAGESICRNRGIDYLEAWTRDDEWVNNWYKSRGFNQVSSYYHVFIGGSQEAEAATTAKIPNFKLLQGFAHYSGDQVDDIKSKFKRVHECRCYEKELN